jgi:hypothetical protein
VWIPPSSDHIRTGHGSDSHPTYQNLDNYIEFGRRFNLPEGDLAANYGETFLRW